MDLSEKLFLMVCHTGCDAQSGFPLCRIQHQGFKPEQETHRLMVTHTQHRTRRCQQPQVYLKERGQLLGKWAVPSQVCWLGLSRTPFLGTQGPRASDGRMPLASLCCSGSCCRCLSSSSAVCGLRAPTAKCKCSGSGDLSSARWGAGNSCCK